MPFEVFFLTVTNINQGFVILSDGRSGPNKTRVSACLAALMKAFRLYRLRPLTDPPKIGVFKTPVIVKSVFTNALLSKRHSVNCSCRPNLVPRLIMGGIRGKKAPATHCWLDLCLICQQSFGKIVALAWSRKHNLRRTGHFPGNICFSTLHKY